MIYSRKNTRQEWEEHKPNKKYSENQEENWENNWKKMKKQYNDLWWPKWCSFHILKSLSLSLTFQICQWKFLQIYRLILNLLSLLDFIINYFTKLSWLDFVIFRCDINCHTNFTRFISFTINEKIVKSSIRTIIMRFLSKTLIQDTSKSNLFNGFEEFESAKKWSFKIRPLLKCVAV